MKRTAVALLLVAAFPTPPVRAEKAPQPPTFSSQITVMSLPVYVTDRKGHAVGGLTADDFTVEDNGRPVPIVGFREIDAAQPPAEDVDLPPSARRQFLLLFDLSFTSVSGLMRSRKAAVDFVRNGLGPSDLAAVATFSANYGVSMLTGFISDRGQLQRAVETLGLLQRDRQADPLGLAYDLTELGAALGDSLPEETSNLVGDAMRAVQMRYQRSQEAAYRQRVLSLLEGMGELGRALDAVQGRKQVIFLSNGFDDTVLTGEQGRQAAADSEAIVRGRLWEVQSENRFGDAQVRQLMVEMLRGFSGSDAVVHTVDMSGLAAKADARFQGAGRNLNQGEPLFVSGRESLAEMANLSGGRLFKDVNDVSHVFRELSEMSRRYYLLAFEPESAARPGRFHKLKVKVKTKGAGVSHRSGYYERAEFGARAPLARRFEAAEMISKGAGPSEIPLSVLALPYVRSGGKVAVPVVLEASGAALLKGAAADRLSLEFYGYAIGEGGDVEDFVALASNLDLAKVGGRLRENGLQAHATFTLAPGRHSLRFLLRDAVSGRSATHFMEVSIPQAMPNEVVLLPPLFMDDADRWLIVHAPSKGTKVPGSPFQVARDVFAPRPRPTLTNGREQRVCLLALDGNRQYDAGASFEILPSLLDSGGLVVPFSDFRLAQAVAGEDGYRRFVLSFTPEGVGAGDYSLRVRVRDPASGRVGESFQSVRVE